MGETLKEEWESVHQPYELNYHLSEGVEWCKDEKQFNDFWNEIKEWIEPSGELLDIGCGPRPPFKGYAIEPLMVEYMKITPKEWWQGIKGLSIPAEEELKWQDKFDTIVCWNCIDHTYDWRKILDNIAKYIKPEGKVAIATDHYEPRKGHPSFKKDDFMEEIQKRFEIIKLKEDFKERQLCLILKVKK